MTDTPVLVSRRIISTSIEFPKYIDNDALGIYWIGDQDETSAAKAYLIEAGGQNYDDPSMYLKWWRKNYHRVDY